jgi:hypothetical protein
MRPAADSCAAASPLFETPTEYQPPSQSREAGLRYALILTTEPTGIDGLKDLLGPMPMLDLAHRGETRIEISHWQGYSRAAALCGGWYGEHARFLFDPRGGYVYLDTKDRVFFRLDERQLPKSPTRRVQRPQLTLEPGQIIEGFETQIASLRLAAPVPVEYRIWFTRQPRLEAFARQMFDFINGCTECLEQAGVPVRDLLSLGAPIRTELRIRDASKPVLVGAFHDFDVRELDAKDFQIPSEYRDLRHMTRESPGQAREGWQAPRPPRTSAFRRARAVPDRAAPSDAGAALSIRSSFMDDFGPHFTGPQTDGLQLPQCLPSTFASQVGLAVEQGLLDDIRFLVNQALKRLTTFSSNGNSIDFNWRDQWDQLAHPDGASVQDGLFQLMFAPPPPRLPPPAKPPHDGGLLVRLARRQARRAMMEGNVSTLVILEPALLFQVVTALATQPAHERFDKLPEAAQIALTNRFMEQRIGRFVLNYKGSTTPEKTFHDLMYVGLDGIDFDVRIQDGSDKKTSVTRLNATGQGEIDFQLDLPHVRAAGWIGRAPTAEYFLALGASGILCGLMPLLCSLGTAVALAGIFLFSDYAYVRIKLDDLKLKSVFNFIPSKENVLRPNVKSLELDADINVVYLSPIPTGLHQLIGFVYSLVGSHTDLVLNEMEGQLKKELNELLEKTLDIRFPPRFGPNPLYGLASAAIGVQNDHLYMESLLNAGITSVSPPYVTQVGTNIYPALLEKRNLPTFDRRYAGFVISQNFINHFINSRWRDGEFNFEFVGQDEDELIGHLAIALAGQRPQGHLHAHLWPAVTPRTMLTPRSEVNNGPYATTIFDDLRLCLTVAPAENSAVLLPATHVEIQFAAQVNTQIGFGGIDPDTRELDLNRFSANFMDLYFDLDGAGVRLVNVETQCLTIEGSAYSGFDIQKLEGLQFILEFALKRALRSRNDRAIPGDPGNRWVQRYRIPGARVDVHLFSRRGNLYGWLGLVGDGTGNHPKGLLEIFPGGTLDLDQDKLTPNVADFLLETAP